MKRVVHQTCPLCEATCGLRITVDGDEIVDVRGDQEDVFSAGYVCPKGVAIGELHADPDRLRRPLRRVGDGWEEIDWEAALDLAAEKLQAAALVVVNSEDSLTTMTLPDPDARASVAALMVGASAGAALEAMAAGACGRAAGVLARLAYDAPELGDEDG